MYNIIQYKFYNSVSNFSKYMLEDASKKSEWSWNSGNSKHGDEIGVSGYNEPNEHNATILAAEI